MNNMLLVDEESDIAKEMKKNEEHSEYFRILQDHYRTSMPVLQESFLASLLTRKLTSQQIEEKSMNYDIQLRGSQYVVALIALYPTEESKEYSSSLLRQSRGVDYMIQAVLNRTREVWDINSLGKVFIYQESIALLAIDNGQHKEHWFSIMQAALSDVLEQIVQELKLNVTIGVGSRVSDIADVHHSYRETLIALDYRLVMGSKKVIYFHNIEDYESEQLRFDELKGQALRNSLKMGTAEELSDAVDTIFDELFESNFALQDIQIYLFEVLTVILRTAKEADIDLDGLLGTSIQLHAEMYRLPGLREAKRWVFDICIEMMRKISSQRKHVYKDIVEEAIQYTKDHFMNPDLSIQEVCSFLHISTGYFSRVFKKEVKLTYGQYVMHIRIEAVKQMLRLTELKASEIADRVGITDPKYLGFCFKKHVGISLTEYRSRITESLVKYE